MLQSEKHEMGGEFAKRGSIIDLVIFRCMCLVISSNHLSPHSVYLYFR